MKKFKKLNKMANTLFTWSKNDLDPYLDRNLDSNLNRDP